MNNIVKKSDMHAEDIKAELHKRGKTLSGIAQKHNLNSPSTLSAALTRSLPISERRIAEELDMKPWQIWPSRYTEEGLPLKRGVRAEYVAKGKRNKCSVGE